jgi:hypothetical protein
MDAMGKISCVIECIPFVAQVAPPCQAVNPLADIPMTAAVFRENHLVSTQPSVKIILLPLSHAELPSK